MPTCDLARLYGELAAGLPDDAAFTFHSGSLPAPPAELSTDRILFRKLHHDYNGWYRADMLWMYLNRAKCRELGVFLLSCAFHGLTENVTLRLTHPESAIRTIVIPGVNDVFEDLSPGLHMIPYALQYWPREIDKHPWMYENNVRELPLLALTNEEDCVTDHESRDSVRIWAEQRGSLRFAEFLLNTGWKGNALTEYALEGDAGYRGVGPMSAELKIFLPGDAGFMGDGAFGKEEP